MAIVMMSLAFCLLIGGLVHDYYREVRASKKKADLDKRFYEASKKLDKYFPMAVAEMRAAYESRDK